MEVNISALPKYAFQPPDEGAAWVLLLIVECLFSVLFLRAFLLNLAHEQLDTSLTLQLLGFGVVFHFTLCIMQMRDESASIRAGRKREQLVWEAIARCDRTEHGVTWVYNVTNGQWSSDSDIGPVTIQPPLHAGYGWKVTRLYTNGLITFSGDNAERRAFTLGNELVERLTPAA